jgi:signal peptidase II
MASGTGAEIAAGGDTGTNRRTDTPRTLLTSGRTVTLVLLVATLLVIADQLVKSWITARFGPCGNPVFTPVIGHNAGISYVCNTGTAFSRFEGSPIVWLPVLIAVGAVLWLWVRSLQAIYPLQQFSFALIIGGAIGNVVDRARLGYVVDFIDLRLNDQLRFYVFNVADSCISIGVVLLALAFWRMETRRAARATTA